MKKTAIAMDKPMMRQMAVCAAVMLLMLMLAAMTACGSKATENEKISDDIYSLQFVMDDVLYQLPSKPSDFEVGEWSLMDSDEMLPAGESTSNFLKKGSNIIMINLYNDSDEEKLLCDCTIYKLTLLPMKGVDLTLPKGLSFDESITPENLKECYGEPTSVSETEKFSMLRYTKSEECEVMFTLFEPNSGDSGKNMMVMRCR